MIEITVAVEDGLSEEAIKTILRQTRRYSCNLIIGKKGNTYLKSKARNFNQSAAGTPILLLTDQDTRDECPPSKIADWLGQGVERHRNFLFRVAAMEIEAWLLADRDKIADFLTIPDNRIPYDVETIDKPKEFLVNLARSARNRSIRDDLVPRAGSTAAVGPNYNAPLIKFAREIWRPDVACEHCSSLRRTMRRLMEFEPIGIDAP